jgi:hypothetical protein
MAQRQGYVWGKKPKHKVDIESSIGDRLTRARSGDVSAAIPEPVKQVKNAPPRSAGGAVLTPELVAMRDAARQSHKDARTEKSRTEQMIAIAQDTATVQAIFSSWMAQTPAFVQTEHNLNNMANALQRMVAAGKPISIPVLNDIFNYLYENNFLEKATRVRGQAAARVIAPLPEETDEVYRGRTVQVFAPPTAEEKARLKAMPMHELALQVRKGYRTETPPYQPKF